MREREEKVGEREERGGGHKNRDIKCMEKERGEGGKREREEREGRERGKRGEGGKSSLTLRPCQGLFLMWSDQQKQPA